MQGKTLHRALTAILPALVAGTLSSAPVGSAHSGELPISIAAPATFTHPGVLVSRAQLDTMRTRVNAGTQPQKRAYDAMLASRYASLSYTPHPRAVVECGPVSNPNLGCTDEREDAIAAYTHAGVGRIHSGPSAGGRVHTRPTARWQRGSCAH
jgi:hypothetical protein